MVSILFTNFNLLSVFQLSNILNSVDIPRNSYLGCTITMYASLSTHASNLCGPVEHSLWVDVGTVLAHIVQQRSKRHQWHNEHQLSSHTDGDDTQTIRMNYRRHYTSFVQQFLTLRCWRSFIQNLDGHWQLHILIRRHPNTLSIIIHATEHAQ